MKPTGKQYKKLISIILMSTRHDSIQGFLNNLRDTITDPSQVEILVKVDELDLTLQKKIQSIIQNYGFEIRYITLPTIENFLALHTSYRKLLELSNKESYFLQILNDDVRFQTVGWDTILAKYVNFFPDNIFRLKMSATKYYNYFTMQDCTDKPENFPITTRCWVELAEGLGDCWESPAWQQHIDFHLGKTLGINNIPGLFRSIPINDILMTGNETSLAFTPERSAVKVENIFQEWWHLHSSIKQQDFRRIAVKMFAHIWAANENIHDFKLLHNDVLKNYTIRNNLTRERVKVLYYHVSKNHIRMQIFKILLRQVRGPIDDRIIKAFLKPAYCKQNGISGWFIRLKRRMILRIAIFFTPKPPKHKVLTTFKSTLPHELNNIG